jgi:hypothetical protein
MSYVSSTSVLTLSLISSHRFCEVTASNPTCSYCTTGGCPTPLLFPHGRVVVCRCWCSTPAGQRPPPLLRPHHCRPCVPATAAPASAPPPPCVCPPPRGLQGATLLSSLSSLTVVARRPQRPSLSCMSVDGRELVPHDWEADAEQGGNVPVLFLGVAPLGRDCADAGRRLERH